LDGQAIPGGGLMGKRIEPYKNIALIYDQVRPGYPAKLIDDIIAATNIGL